jgi:hypothetical protein
MTWVNRPRAAPRTMARVDVGVDSIRRATPSWRVWMSPAEPANPMTNMNSRIWLEALTSNVPKSSSSKMLSPTVEVATVTVAMSAWSSVARSRAASNEVPSRSAANRAAWSRMACWSTAAPTTGWSWRPTPDGPAMKPTTTSSPASRRAE